MKIEPQRNPELKRLAEMVKDMNVAMLTSLNDEGQLVARPMAPLQMDAEGAIWFFTDVHSEKVEFLQHFNLSFSDEKNATYVSLSGHGELSQDRDRITALWTPFVRPWFPDGPETANLALLKFVPHAADCWNASDSKMVRMLAMAASVAAGRPVGLGAHEHLSDLPASARAPADIA
jgi:general stress protein 26